MAEKQYPLSLVIRAVNRAAGPLRAINAQINRVTGPVRALGASLTTLSNEAGLPKLVDGFKGVGTAAGRVGNEAFRLGARIAAIGAIASAALFSIVHGALEAGDELGEMSERTGTSVDFFASFRHAAAQADVSAEDFNSAMDKFNKNLGDMRAGGGPLLALLKKVGPGLAAQVKGAKSTEEALSFMTDAFDRIEDPQRRAALAAAAFGKSGLQMGQFLGQGSAAIQKQMVEYMRIMGPQDEFAKSAGALDNALRPLGVAFLSLRNVLASQLFPALTSLAKIATELYVAHREDIRKWANEVGRALNAWLAGGGLRRIIEDARALIDTVVNLVDKIGGWKNAALALAAIVSGPLLAAVASMTVAVIELGVALLTTPVGWVIAGIAALAAAVYLVYKYWGPFNDWMNTKVWGPLGEGVMTAFGAVKDFVAQTWDGIVSVIQIAWEKIKPIVDLIMEAVQLSPFGMAVEAGKTLGAKLLGETERTSLGAQQTASQLATRSQAHVTVDFNNAPRGTRVATKGDGGAQVDTSLGMTMADAH